MPQQSVQVRVVRGNLTLFDPTTGAGSNQITANTTTSGDATVAVMANAVGDGTGVLQVTVPGTSLKSFVVIKIVN
jgi:hypothetical protein